jgi:hypothetical protein
MKITVDEFTRWLEGYGRTIAGVEWSRATKTYKLEP